MRPRFVALMSRDDGAGIDPALRTRLAAAGLDREIRRPGVTVYVDRATCCVPIGQHGLVLGVLFSRSGGPPLHAVDDAARRLIIGSRGRQLIDAYWGAYAAILSDPDNGVIDIVRDPSPLAPLYHGLCAAGRFLATNLDVLRSSGLIPITLARAPLAAYLLDGAARPPDSCIAGLTEVTSGTRLTLQGDTLSATALWSPWDFADRSRQINDPDEAEARLREEILRCVDAWSRIIRRPLLGVSGGLDSSIVAAALKAAGAEVTCITIATEDARGDERHHARQLASGLELPLVERFEVIGAVDLSHSAAAHVPRPTARAFAQSGDSLQRAIADEVGSDGYMTGAGGDNLFCYMRSVTPLLDRLLAEGPGRGALATATDIAHLCDQSLAGVIARALRRLAARSGYHAPEAPDFLSPEGIDLARTVPPHPWIHRGTDAPPGKQMHCAWIRGIENHLEGYSRERDRPSIAPLMSQPIIELCLRVPSWFWYRGGRDRALARRAFSGLLPAAIVERRTKGTPSSFVMQLFEHHRALIGQLLDDGVLAGSGLIDPSVVREQLSIVGPIRSNAYLRLMALVDAEAWARTVQGGRPVEHV